MSCAAMLDRSTDASISQTWASGPRYDRGLSSAFTRSGRNKTPTGTGLGHSPTAPDAEALPKGTGRLAGGAP
jgi:hypothetical protein